MISAGTQGLLAVISLLSLAALSGVADAIPVEKTNYGASGLRLEIRPDPLWFGTEGMTFEQLESALAASGTTARWVGAVDPLGNPEFDSKYIKSNKTDLGKREAALKEWVKEIHKQGMAALSWYPLSLSESGWASHPEWRQEFIIENPAGVHQRIGCCINTGYGRALIDFCNEAIDRFGLDGIWFDGSALTQIWDRPVGLSCVCDDCKRLFKKQTGLDAPDRVDWNDQTFRRWVAWRYDMFGDYIGRLAAGIRKKHPNAAVMINHYHRPLIPWQSAIPLNPYPADIISGSEATGEPLVDLTMRLCRAYGRSQSEVWKPFEVGEHPGSAPQTDELMHHALACVTAGGMPSFGTSPNTTTVPGTAKYVAALLNALKPYVGGGSVPYAALHLSQQSETFYFSREAKGVGWALEPYWKSIMGWNSGLMEGHVPPDYVYDKLLEPKNLSKYKMLLLPMSQALSDEQCHTALRFAKDGGVLMLGIGAGMADEWGQKRSENPLERALGFSFDGAPTPAATESVYVTLAKPGGSEIGKFAALYAPLDLRDAAWQVLYTGESEGRIKPAGAVRPFGKGRVVAIGVDLGGATASAFQAVTGGDTAMTVTDETAAQGKHSLKLTDGPDAPQTFYPDMEIRFQPFGAPEAAMGRLICDLRIGKGAQAAIELRSSMGKLGPYVNLGREGNLWSKDKALCEIPQDKWLHLEIAFRLIGESRTFDVALTPEGEAVRTFTNLAYKDADFQACDWAVIFGEGTEHASFYLDDLRIESISDGPEAKVITVLADDFEATPVGSVSPRSYVCDLTRDLLEMAPAPIELDAPANIRIGAFRRTPGQTIIHLHDVDATRRTKPGTPVTIRTRFAINSATLVLSGKQLKVEKIGDGFEVSVPAVGMHEVVVLR